MKGTKKKRSRFKTQQLGPPCATMERLDVFVARHEEAHCEPRDGFNLTVRETI
jgi:hypothetical protein